MGSVDRDDDDGHLSQPLLPESFPNEEATHEQRLTQEEDHLGRKVWLESKKLWLIVGPSIFSRLAAFTMNVVTQAFAGHLGDVQLASISIANTVIVGFNFGLLVYICFRNLIPEFLN